MISSASGATERRLRSARPPVAAPAAPPRSLDGRAASRLVGLAWFTPPTLSVTVSCLIGHEQLLVAAVEAASGGSGQGLQKKRDGLTIYMYM